LHSEEAALGEAGVLLLLVVPSGVPMPILSMSNVFAGDEANENIWIFVRWKFFQLL
jgi:hypothetical protein